MTESADEVDEPCEDDEVTEPWWLGAVKADVLEAMASVAKAYEKWRTMLVQLRIYLGVLLMLYVVVQYRGEMVMT